LSRGAAVSLASALLFAPACGGSDESPPAAPKLPRALAESLAAKSDAVAARLEAGDTCGAAEEATSLRDATVAAIDDGEVPAAFEDELEASVTELASEIRCEEDEERGNGEDKGKGKGENGKGENGKGGRG
jgi:hypothetical protein